MIKRPKKNNNECPICLKEERAYPYCRLCGRWVGEGGEVHHSPGKKLGGSVNIWCNHPEEHGNKPGYRLERLCGECHSAEHGVVVGDRRAR